MLCMSCGKDVGDNVRLCPSCAKINESSKPELDRQSSQFSSKQNNSQSTEDYEYAGFWLRAIAHTLDSYIAIFLIIFWSIILVSVKLGILFILKNQISNGSMVTVGFALVAIFFVLLTCLYWGYFVIFESSKFQATPGKLAVGIAVVDRNDQRISLMHSLGRNAGKVLSSILCLGYIAAAFTEHKQGFHDILANTYVIKNKEISNLRLVACIFICILLTSASFIAKINSDKIEKKFDNIGSKLAAKSNLDQLSSGNKISITENTTKQSTSSNLEYGTGNVNGVVRGEAFNPVVFKYSKFVKTLTFASDKEFFPRYKVTIFHFNDDIPETGKFIYVKNDSKSSSPHVHVSSYINKTFDNKSYTKNYTLSLRYIKLDDRSLSGVISLSIPEENLEFSGEFSAAVEEK